SAFWPWLGHHPGLKEEYPQAANGNWRNIDLGLLSKSGLKEEYPQAANGNWRNIHLGLLSTLKSLNDVGSVSFGNGPPVTPGGESRNSDGNPNDDDYFGFISIPIASNKSFVSSPMVDDCVSVFDEYSFTSDESVHLKPSVTELYAVKDEAFMVDKKYVNVTDLNLAFDEKLSISDRDDLKKKIDGVQVLNNVVCVDPNNVTDPNEAKTSTAVDSVVRNKFNDSDEVVEFATKEVGSNNVDVNKDEDVADEDVDLAGQNVFVADQKSFLGDEAVDFCQKNYVVSEQKMFIGDEDVEFPQNNYVVLNVCVLF
ncbi:hypothetical protein Tco_0673192, partial [Tanacetum coccineum]